MKTLSLCLPVINNIQDHLLLVLLMGIILRKEEQITEG